MINTTDRPIVLLKGKALDKAIRQSLTWAADTLRAALDKTEVRPYLRGVFDKFLGPSNRAKRQFDEGLVHALYDWQDTDARSIGSAPAMARLAEYVVERTVPASSFPNVKRGVRLALVDLWRRGAVLLPSVFTPGPHFDTAAYEHEVLRWVSSFATRTDHEGRKKTDFRRLFNYGPRLVWATNWRTVEDICVNDIAMLHLAQLRAKNGSHPHRISASPFPYTQLPAEAMKAFPGRVLYTSKDLQRYSAWCARNEANRGDLESFSEAERPPLKKTRKARGDDADRRDASHTLSREMREASTHGAVLTLFARLTLRRGTVAWDTGVHPVYPGREHVDLSSIAPLWVESFQAWLHHRKHIQRLRSLDARASLNILADYIFLYLPWWKELYPTGRVDIPCSPKEFIRYAFVTRSPETPLEALPTPLLEIIRLRRRSAESAGVCIRHMAEFFRFVGTHFGEDERVGGARYRNPFDEEFDVPRGKRKNNKTTKNIIPRHLYGHLLSYCYAAEAFGQRLLKRALAGEFQDRWRRMRSELRFNCHEFGIVPSFSYRGCEYHVREVPNVFTWAEREVDRDGVRVKLVVPHLTALRLLTAAVETGLRLQSLQWLDRTTFDSLNQDVGQQYVYRLLVNTDKTKEEAWIGHIVYRVRNQLNREVEFQRLFSDFEAYPPVLYEENDASPFEPILPVFRAPTAGTPIRDDVYYDAWTRLLVGFETFYRNASGENHVALYYFKPLREADGSPVVRSSDGKGAVPFCPISLLTFYTPHSCRATFATNRQRKGLLELEDVCELLGHEDVITTSHYDKPSSEQIAARLEQSDADMLSDYSLFEAGNNSVFVRADRPESHLRRSFERDRERAIKTFSFIGPVALWSISDEKLREHDGMEMLKSGPMARICFRETHICPVGEECPVDILEHIGEPKRCGLCPLAMKCVDHLPAISAKAHLLHERIQYLHAHLRRLKACNEPQSTLDSVWDDLQLDTNEYLGWKASEATLQRMLSEATNKADEDIRFLVEQPEIVSRHLRLVTRQRGKAEFLLQRIAESSAFPSMTSPQVQVEAAQIRRRLLANQGLERFAAIADGEDDVRATTAMLFTIMRAGGVGLNDVVKLLASPTSFRQSKQELLTIA